MEIHSYNQELAIANLQFIRLFNNIQIQDKDGKLTNVNCVIGNRSRIFKNLENPNREGEYSLPMIIVQRTGITKNDDRLANVNNEVKYATHSNVFNYNLYTPVPIDISYQVTVASKRQGDVDRILSNFIPFFNKDAFVRFKHPKFDGILLKCQVIMDNSISEDHPEDLDPSNDDVVVCTCTFIFKTWIFCGNDVASGNGNYITHKISADPCTGESVVIDTEYNGFIPAIRHINIGFYPVPLMSDFIEHFEFVDGLSAKGIDDSPYVDRLIWKIDETGEITGQVGNSYHYPQFSSEYVSNYYDVIGGQPGHLSDYNYLSGPDEAHQRDYFGTILTDAQ